MMAFLLRSGDVKLLWWTASNADLPPVPLTSLKVLNPSQLPLFMPDPCSLQKFNKTWSLLSPCCNKSSVTAWHISFCPTKTAHAELPSCTASCEAAHSQH